MNDKVFIREERIVPPFSRISLRDFGTVILQQGKGESLVVETTPDLMPKIDTEVKGDTLQLRVRQSWLGSLLAGSAVFGSQQVKYLITGTNIQALSIFGSTIINAERLQPERLDIDIHGQGEVKIDWLLTETLSTSVHGQARLRIAGEVKNLNISISGAGEVDLSKAKNYHSVLKIHGNGTAQLWCDEVLDVSINGMGKVSYRGNPKVKQRISGLGELIRLDEIPQSSQGR